MKFQLIMLSIVLVGASAAAIAMPEPDAQRCLALECGVGIGDCENAGSCTRCAFEIFGNGVCHVQISPKLYAEAYSQHRE
jgi:hypothetical protein